MARPRQKDAGASVCKLLNGAVTESGPNHPQLPHEVAAPSNKGSNRVKDGDTRLAWRSEDWRK
jgi:hypothetical protein